MRAHGGYHCGPLFTVRTRTGNNNFGCARYRACARGITLCFPECIVKLSSREVRWKINHKQCKLAAIFVLSSSMCITHNAYFLRVGVIGWAELIAELICNTVLNGWSIWLIILQQSADMYVCMYVCKKSRLRWRKCRSTTRAPNNVVIKKPGEIKMF